MLLSHSLIFSPAALLLSARCEIKLWQLDIIASGVVVKVPEGDVMYPTDDGSWRLGGGAVEGVGKECGRVW